MPPRWSSTYRQPSYSNGEAILGPAWFTVQAMPALVDSSPLGVMSPDAPAFTADSGPPPPKPMPPVPTYSRSLSPVGLALARPACPPSVQRISPVVGSYDRI